MPNAQPSWYDPSHSAAGVLQQGGRNQPDHQPQERRNQGAHGSSHPSISEGQDFRKIERDSEKQGEGVGDGHLAKGKVHAEPQKQRKQKRKRLVSQTGIRSNPGPQTHHPAIPGKHPEVRRRKRAPETQGEGIRKEVPGDHPRSLKIKTDAKFQKLAAGTTREQIRKS
jgi:hypothetical protein